MHGRAEGIERVLCCRGAWARVLNGLLLACCILQPCAATQRPNPASSQLQMDLDIPGQELAGALEAFSRVTGMAVLVDRELTRSRRSSAVRGQFSGKDALNRLLKGTGLMARYVRADAFTLQLPSVVGRAPSSGKAARSAGRAGDSYARAIQQAIEHNLCRSPLTRPGTYRALLQVWIGPGGEIQYNRLVSSTGDLERDAALVDAMTRVRIGQLPPSSLGQPVTLLLTHESAGKSMECIGKEGAWGP